MIALAVEGVGLCGPGLDGWAAGRAILAAPASYLFAPTQIPASQLLPANERRRAAQIVKIALAAGAEAFAAAGHDPALTPTVFASSGGDGETIHGILNTLAATDRALSPTRFHNSVHNAAAGYWSIATGATAASTSLCCHDDSFAAGLLEAAVQAAATGQSVGLIAYDVQYPAPLNAERRIGAPFAVALVLRPATAAFPQLELELLAGAAPPTPAGAPALEALRQNTPAARCLPLLAALAAGAESTVRLDYLTDMTLALRVSPLAQ
jgi:hypothetical protein